ncbi:MAG: FlgD immunoglobulin-like domain containing protein [Bacteroidales bacterium]
MKKLFTLALFLVTASFVGAQSLLYQDFSGSWPPTGWTFDSHSANWLQSPTSNAGGTAPEATFYWSPQFTGTSHFISPMIDLTGINKVDLQFLHMVDDYSGGYSIGVATRHNSGAWNIVWQIAVTQPIPATSVYIPISNGDVNSPTFQFSFFFNGPSYNINNWYIDNVDLFNPYHHDVKASKWLITDQFTASTPFTPSIQVMNIGRNTETFPVVFNVYDASNTLIHTESATVSNLLVDSSTTTTFTDYALPDANNLYTAQFYTNLSGDMDHSNDTMANYINTYTHSKQQVMMEVGTGTGCQYCPGAMMGAEDLISHGDTVAVVEYHAYNSSDPYYNSYAVARCAYYGITGFPTAFFDGLYSFIGGSNNQSMYQYYLPLYQQSIAKKTAFEFYFTQTHFDSSYTVTVYIHKLATFLNTNTVLQFVVTESHIAYHWQGQDSLQFVERTMVPDANGTSVDMTNDTVKEINLNFTVGSSWVLQNLEVSAFLQDSNTKEIFNGNKAMLINLITTGIGEHNNSGEDMLVEAYPNPMVTRTTVPAIIDKEGSAIVNIYNFTGQKVKTLYDGNISSGRHDFIWNGTDDNNELLPDGVYFCRMIKDDNTYSQKILINR